MGRPGLSSRPSNAWEPWGYARLPTGVPSKPGHGVRSARRLEFFDLVEFQFHRRGATKNRYRDLHARPPFVAFLNHAVERCEWPVRHAHLLTYLERHRRLRPFDALLHLV